MRKFNWKLKHTFFIIFVLFFLYSFHNALYYPARGSFDAASHYNYAKVLTTFWRMPTFKESAHFFNPPLWYFFGGLITNIFAPVISENLFILNYWKPSVKIWQLLNPLFTILTVFFWLKIYQKFYPKDKNRWLFFIFFLFSLPVLQKMTAMLSIEPLLLFFSSAALFVFINKFLNSYKSNSLIIVGFILGLALLSKITIFSLIFTLLIVIVFIKIIKKKSFNFLAKSIILLLLPILLISGWFYVWKQYHQHGITSLAKPGKQEKAFFFSLIPRLMLSYPMRQYFGQRFWPIMYTDFWGDYWNYYSQRRFGIDIEYIRTVNKLETTPERIKVLIYQNAINIPATLLMAVAFFWACWETAKKFLKKDYSQKNLFYLTLIIFFSLTCLGYLWFQSRTPKWDGSLTKPFHMLFVWPVPVFFATEFLFDITKKKKFLQLVIVLFFIFNFISNLIFGWF